MVSRSTKQLGLHQGTSLLPPPSLRRTNILGLARLVLQPASPTPTAAAGTLHARPWGSLTKRQPCIWHFHACINKVTRAQELRDAQRTFWSKRIQRKLKPPSPFNNPSCLNGGEDGKRNKFDGSCPSTCLFTNPVEISPTKNQRMKYTEQAHQIPHRRWWPIKQLHPQQLPILNFPKLAFLCLLWTPHPPPKKKETNQKKQKKIRVFGVPSVALPFAAAALLSSWNCRNCSVAWQTPRAVGSKPILATKGTWESLGSGEGWSGVVGCLFFLRGGFETVCWFYFLGLWGGRVSKTVGLR